MAISPSQSAKRRIPVIGLVGGIGSGKSSVAAEFARHGAVVISGDKLGHEALRQPEIRAKAIGRFGPSILGGDGEINRRALAAIVFPEAEKLRDLESIVFPFIEKGLREQVAAAQRNPAVPFIVVDAAVMLEAGWEGLCDKIIYVDAPLRLRLARLASQRGWTKEEVSSRSQAQLTTQKKAARAHATIDNSGPLAALGPQVAQLLTAWGIPIAFQSRLGDNE